MVEPRSGEVHDASIFLAVLGASNSPFAEATWSQSLPDWIGSHVRAFAALGGVPQVLVPENLKAAVSRSHRSEPELHRTSEALAQHYGVAVVPARAARPRDNAKVEVGDSWWSAGCWPDSAITPSSPSQSCIRPYVPSWSISPTDPSRNSPVAGTACSPQWIARPSGPCQPPPMRLPSGHWSACTSTTMSRARGTTTRCRPLVTQQLDARLSAQTIELFHKGTRLASHDDHSNKAAIPP